MVAVSDLDPEKLAIVSKRYPAVRTTTRYQDLLEDPDIDAIAIGAQSIASSGDAIALGDIAEATASDAIATW